MARARAAGAALLLACAAAAAQTVSLQGMLGRQALLVIDGAAPKGVAPGTTWRGVTVVSTSGDEAVIEVAGRRETLRVGETTGNVGAKGPVASGDRIVLTAGAGGHFVTQGTINGHTASLMVHTGATYVSLGASDARRLGLDYKRGEPGITHTANGNAPAWRIKLRSVRIGDVEIRDVDAVVSPQPMALILLGNSFLNRFQMKRDNDQMVLQRRY